VAADAVVSAGPKVVAMLGSGALARSHALALRAVRPVSEIRVGIHVEVVWAPENERSAADIDNRSRGSGGDIIVGWRTTGEPDEPADRYLDRMM
jgi:ornithine cyclodeaminase/alanine dehydrogenase-like protein (mu-crystallin family)